MKVIQVKGNGAFFVEKGEKGDPGKDASPVEIVNDLTTGGVDKALSAEQGKVLFQCVDDGKNKVANAIIDKGVTGVSKDSTFSELAAGIGEIETYLEQTTDGSYFNMTDMFESNDTEVNLRSFIGQNREKMVVFPNLFDFRSNIRLEGLFKDCKNLRRMPKIVLAREHSANKMFYNCAQLEAVKIINAYAISSATSMFEGCKSLKSVYLDYTENMKNIDYMFRGCKSLTVLKRMYFANAVSYKGMFYECYSLDIDAMRKLGWEEKFLMSAPNYVAP